ncbi:MAG TPA: hypothetical protein PLW83_05060 [Deltaproteobacteria bacterium]|nr:hypothetical protein [Deltaproteobacteria bacterium]
MEMTCHKCGYRDHYVQFAYLCKNGCPACGESDLRRCPRCGAECVFFRSEALDEEASSLESLVGRLDAIHRGDSPERIDEARRIVARLYEMNRRWNIAGLGDYLVGKQKELFF